MQFRLRSNCQFRVARCCKPILRKSTGYKSVPTSPRNTAATPNFPEMFSVSVAGSTRRPVIVIGPWALKFARNDRGRASSLYEARLYRTTTEKRRSLLCPILWVSPRGWLLVARSALPLGEMMTLDEYLAVAKEWDQMAGEDPCPFEPKASDWGWYKGRRVALDYSTPAWD